MTTNGNTITRSSPATCSDGRFCSHARASPPQRRVVDGSRTGARFGFDRGPTNQTHTSRMVADTQGMGSRRR